MMAHILRPLLIALAVAVASAAPGVSAQEGDRFASVIDDLPLMDGLAENGDGVTFSTGQGRIAEVVAQGAVTRAQVRAFYGETLPQLGWTAAGKDRFTREGESLELVFDTGADGLLNVRFSLAPSKR